MKAQESMLSDISLLRLNTAILIGTTVLYSNCTSDDQNDWMTLSSTDKLK